MECSPRLCVSLVDNYTIQGNDVVKCGPGLCVHLIDDYTIESDDGGVAQGVELLVYLIDTITNQGAMMQ